MDEWMRIRIVVDTGFAGAAHEDEIEVKRADWEAMTEEQRDEYMEDHMQDAISNHISTHYEIAED